MSEDDLIHNYPRTLGDCWEIFKRNGIQFNHVDDNQFPNARKILKLENKAEGKIKSFTVSELVSELRKRDGVEVVDVPLSHDYGISVWNEEKSHEDIITLDGSGKAIILRITD